MSPKSPIPGEGAGKGAPLIKGPDLFGPLGQQDGLVLRLLTLPWNEALYDSHDPRQSYQDRDDENNVVDWFLKDKTVRFTHHFHKIHVGRM